MIADRNQKLGAVITRARTDPDFKARLLADGNAALAECGAQVRPGVIVKAVEDTGAVVHLVLPAMPTGAELTDGRLDGITGGHGPASAAMTAAAFPWIGFYLDAAAILQVQ